MKRDLLIASLLAGTLLSLSACAGSLTYTIEPMKASIVDAETKQPLEGVVVVAHWELEHGTVGGNVPSGQLKVMEAVTDKDGKFSFPGFGPETVWGSFLVDKDPELLIFKSGYEYRRLLNPYYSERELRTHPVRRSDWDGRTIELKKFGGTPQQWFKTLERVVPPYDKPEDAKHSLMLRAILAEEKSVPDSIPYKGPFFDNIVRRSLGLGRWEK